MKKKLLISMIIISFLILIAVLILSISSPTHKRNLDIETAIKSLVDKEVNEYCNKLESLEGTPEEPTCPTCKRQETEYSIEKTTKGYEVKGNLRIYFNFPNRVSNWNFTIYLDEELNLESEFPEIKCVY
jgi:hypothetical protein